MQIHKVCTFFIANLSFRLSHLLFNCRQLGQYWATSRLLMSENKSNGILDRNSNDRIFGIPEHWGFGLVPQKPFLRPGSTKRIRAPVKKRLGSGLKTRNLRVPGTPL